MEKNVQSELRELRLEILREVKTALAIALKKEDSAMVAAIAEILKQF